MLLFNEIVHLFDQCLLPFVNDTFVSGNLPIEVSPDCAFIGNMIHLFAILRRPTRDMCDILPQAIDEFVHFCMLTVVRL